MTFLAVMSDDVPPHEVASGKATVFDRPHAVAEVRDRFKRSGPFAPAALRWTASDPRRDGDGAAVRGSAGPIFELAEHVGWLAAASEVAATDPRDVVKQVSFLCASETVTRDEFRAHYRDHVALARRLMPSLWQYVQYDVVDVTGRGAEQAGGIVAVSVLWFRSTHDFLHRYFLTRADEDEFRSHEGFLDLARAFSLVLSSHPGSGATDRP